MKVGCKILLLVTLDGDDFVALIPGNTCEKLCQSILAHFDHNVGRYFTENDLDRGYIEVANRKGIIEQFPLTSLSIGVVIADVGRFSNILEIGEVVMRLTEENRKFNHAFFVLVMNKNTKLLI